MAFKAIPVVSSKVIGSHTDMPLLVKPSVISGIGSLTLAQAQSSRFYFDEAKTTELAREVVSADEIHVKVGTVDTSTTIYIDYDGARSDYASTDTYGRNAVWSTYGMVSHDGGATLDSTGNHTLTAHGSISSGGISGKIGSGTVYDGTDDYVDLGVNLINPNNNYTYSAWVKLNEDNNHNCLFGVENGDLSPNGYYTLIFRSDSLGTCMQIDPGFPGASFPPTGSQTLSVSEGLTLIHMTKSGSTYTFYKDGASIKTSTDTTTGLPTGLIDTIGWLNAGSGNYVDADVSEARIATNAKSASWIETEYNNQNSNASFWGTATDIGTALNDTLFFGSPL